MFSPSNKKASPKKGKPDKRNLRKHRLLNMPESLSDQSPLFCQVFIYVFKSGKSSFEFPDTVVNILSTSLLVVNRPIIHPMFV